MKIIAISASPKGKASNTLKLLEAAADGAKEAGADVEIVDVTKLKVNFCRGDSSCYRTGSCFQDDDYADLKEKIVAADGIVLSAPNYIDNVPAQLKVVLDRSANFIHEQLLDGKYGFTIVTSGSPNYEMVLDMMDNFIAKSGGLRTGRLGLAMAHGPDAAVAAGKKAREMGKDLAQAIKEKRAYPEQVSEHKKWKDQFAVTVKFNKENWKHNYDLWVSKGWIKV
ncbi:MAG: Iron-sulfur flavoprotein [Methanocella sp. PtaU1.Bin125]|nr:MAG: Iron-sulfur flavoprotein [Methanocella sp. PtaU1.Bin125]